MIDKSKQQEMILNNGLWQVMWKLSWPAVIAMVLFGLNVVFDAIFVGNYVGEKALAGVSIVYPLTQLSLGLGSMIGVGAGSLLSILIGQNNKEKQAKIVRNVSYLVIVSGILMTLLGLIFMRPLLQVMGASGEELIFAEDYFRITLYGSILWIGGIGYNMIIRAEGKMGTAAWMMGVGLAINVAVNFILMGVFNMGVKGAAWGTNVGMLIYVILFFEYCRRGKATFPTNAKEIGRNPKIVKEILSLGFPSLLMTIMYVIQGIVVMKALNKYGTTQDIAFYGVTFRLFNLFLTPIYGLMRAFQPVAGINFGAKNYERVIQSFKIFTVAAAVIMMPLWLLSMIFPRFVMAIMLPTRAVLASEIANFRILVAIAPLLPIVLIAMTFWPAIKKPKPAGILGIARQVLLYIPAMIFLPKFFGISSIYWGATAIDFTLAILILFLMKREFKQLRMKQD